MITDDLKDAIADGYAEIDELAEDHQEAFKKRVLELLNNPSVRNVKLWEKVGADPRVTAANFGTVPVKLRNETWLFRFSRLITAAKEQAFTELLARPLIAATEKARQAKRQIALKMKLPELKKAAVEGVSQQKFNAAKERRKAQRAT